MNAPRFHVAESLVACGAGAELALPEAVAHHAVRVLRLAPGDALTLFDGTGGEWRAELVAADRRGARARLVAHHAHEREAPHAVTLVLAVIAAEPMEFAIRRAVELGAAALAPVRAVRSQGLADDRTARRVAHWRQVAVAACEQCGRNRVPAVADVVPLAAWFGAYGKREGGRAALLGPGARRSLAEVAAERVPDVVLVGPEGGWTAEELAAAGRAGIEVVHLGPRVLRAETAALAALATIQAIAGDAR